MAMEAVVFPQDPFGYALSRELSNLPEFINYWSTTAHGGFSDFGSLERLDQEEEQEEEFMTGSGGPSSSLSAGCGGDHHQAATTVAVAARAAQLNDINDDKPCRREVLAGGGVRGNNNVDIERPKRRRVKGRKNKEEIENQRMTHIAVERNRRKQMNEYLSVLRSLMPHSYVQRGDQASIIGGAINFVKELEQKLQLLVAQKHMDHHHLLNHFIKPNDGDNLHHKVNNSANPSPLLFSEFFATLPNPNSAAAATSSTSSSSSSSSLSSSSSTTPPHQHHPDHHHHSHNNSSIVTSETTATMETSEAAAAAAAAIAEIEVTMVETHASLRIRTKRRPKQLLKLVSALHCLRLTILHLNVATVDQVVLYSISVKVEDDGKVMAVDEISSSVYQIFLQIHQESL